MNSDREPTSSDDELIERLVAYEEALQRGDAARQLNDSVVGLDQESASQFDLLRQCVDLLQAEAPDATHGSTQTHAGHSFDDGPNDNSIPDRMGRFRLRGELGRGGLGVVYLAFDPRLAREVALKVPRPEAIVVRDLRERFLREGRAAALLDHPNIVPVFEVGEDGPICYLTSAYCAGPTLAEWIARHRDTVPVSVAVKLMVQLADAVEHAHTRGVLHRDIKPSNVLLVDRDSVDTTAGSATMELPFTPKLTDFGLAKLTEVQSDATHTGAILGTPAYMAPEQAAGRNRDVNATTDVYALGAILYELLTGRPPLQGESDADTLRRIISDDPLSIRVTRPGVARDLEAICLKCLERSQDKRYESASALGADLRRFLAGQPTLARPINGTQRLLRWLRRHPAIATSLGTALLSLVVIVVGSLSYSMSLQRALERAERSETSLRESLYVADIALAAEAYQAGDVRQVARRLQRHIPAQQGDEDLRGFEWFYLDKQVSHEGEILKHPSPVYDAQFSPDGKLLATACADGQVRLWSVEDNAVVLALRTEHGEVNGLSFDDTGKRLITAGEDGALRIWDIAAGRRVLNVPHAHNDQAFRAIYIDNGAHLASCGIEESVKLWDAVTGQEVATLLGHTGNVETIALSPDGRLLGSAGRDSSLVLWDVASHRALMDVSKSGHRVTNLKFSPNAPWIALARISGEVEMFDIRNGAWLRPELSHIDAVYGLAIDPQGETVATADAAGVVRLWDIASWARNWTSRYWAVPDQLILPEQPAETKSFGESIAVGGDVIVIGDHRSTVDGHAEAGAVDLYQRKDGQWHRATRLFPKKSQPNQRFGNAVCVPDSSGFVVVCAFRDNAEFKDSGAAYVFAPDSTGQWHQTQRLVPDDASFFGLFGTCVVAEEATIAISAAANNVGAIDNAGAVYVFERSNTVEHDWKNTAKLVSANPAPGESFGSTVVLSNRLLVVAAPNAEDHGVNSGIVEVFAKNGNGEWLRQARLAPEDLRPEDRFGTSVALEGNTLIVSAPRQSQAGADYSGALYVFEYRNETWQLVDKLGTNDPRRGQRFGQSLALSDGLLAVTSSTASAIPSETVHLFCRSAANNSGWSEAGVVTPEKVSLGAGHNIELDISRRTLVVGGAGLSQNDKRVGGVKVYNLPELNGEFSGHATDESTHDVPHDTSPYERNATPLVGRWKAHEHRIWSLTYSPDGTLLASAGDDGYVKIWPARRHRMRYEVSPTSYPFAAVTCACEANVMATLEPALGVQLWQDGRIAGKIDLPSVNSNTGLAISDDGSRVAVLDRESNVRLFDARSGALVSTWWQDGVSEVALSPDGDSLAAISNVSGTVYVLDSHGDNEPRRLEVPNLGLQITFVDDGRRLAVVSGNDIVVIDTTTLQERNRLVGHRTSITGLVWLASTGQIVSISGDRTIRYWSVTANSSERVVDLPDNFTAIAVSPDERTIAIGGDNAFIQLWDVASTQPLISIPVQYGVHALRFFSDSKRLMANHYGSHVVIYDTTRE